MSLMQSYKSRPIISLLAALWIIWAFGIQTVGVRLWTEVNGTVVQSRDEPYTHAPRYVTQYAIRQSDGRIITYISGPTDGYLPRSMPIGTKIRKQRWHFAFEMDGKTINDFPILFYAGALGIAVSLFLWSFLQWRGLRGTRIKNT